MPLVCQLEKIQLAHQLDEMATPMATGENPPILSGGGHVQIFKMYQKPHWAVGHCDDKVKWKRGFYTLPLLLPSEGHWCVQWTLRCEARDVLSL
ncbi:hypothetical protein AVEN_97248-1 [Araneus ventricosus]|uniref:Uncharacterized protein n=1 Tax=Araneus ventricosus TaxID=182803 RepID=A0A4Y2JDX1_ARAVE|nr:hypothetical protein AVEN_97248-1 [Araneus ventricosus]